VRIALTGVLSGTASGVLLGLSLKWIEALTQKKVYTLLLNVDFIPWLGRIQWSEQMEFLFHLLIAVLLGATYSFISQLFSIRKSSTLLMLAGALTFPTIFLYFPLSALAVKETPAINDFTSFGYWTFAHVLFAFSLFGTYKLIEKR
jgi:hypothetical protein